MSAIKPTRADDSAMMRGERHLTRARYDAVRFDAAEPDDEQSILPVR